MMQRPEKPACGHRGALTAYAKQTTPMARMDVPTTTLAVHSAPMPWWQLAISIIFLVSVVLAFIVCWDSRGPGRGTGTFLVALFIPVIALGFLALWLWGKVSGRGNLVLRQAAENPLLDKVAKFVPFAFFLVFGISFLVWGFFDKSERIKAWCGAFFPLLIASGLYPHDRKPKH
jgi:hypothetical protein